MSQSAFVKNIGTVQKSNPAGVKVSLLSKGIAFDLNLFRDIDDRFYENQYVYGRTSMKVMPSHRLPQILKLGEGVVTAILRREDSPWQLKLRGNIPQLHYDGKHVQDVELPQRPPYFGKLLSDGTQSESIIAVAGESTPGFFLYPRCFYFERGVPCGFCSLRGNRSTSGKGMAMDFTEANIAEATRLFQKTIWKDIPVVSFTAGTPNTDTETREYVIRLIRAVYDALDPKIPIHALVHPPNDLDLVEEYKKAGVTSIAFNIEVFDRETFMRVCPGKDEFYGYDNWFEALNVARDVFGRYMAFGGLVWGLENIESTMEGNRYLIENGIGIASNIFHSDQHSVMARYPHPSEEDILRIIEHQQNLYLEHPDARTIFPLSMRSTVDWEVKRGDFR